MRAWCGLAIIRLRYCRPMKTVSTGAPADSHSQTTVEVRKNVFYSYLLLQSHNITLIFIKKDNNLDRKCTNEPSVRIYLYIAVVDYLKRMKTFMSVLETWCRHISIFLSVSPRPKLPFLYIYYFYSGNLGL